MFRWRPRFVVLAGSLLAVNCFGLVWIRHSLKTGLHKRVRVLAALPVRDVDATDRLTLIFDEPLVASSTVDLPLERSPFEIDPKPAGRWVWTAPERLEYQLRRPLHPGRNYWVRPTAYFEELTGRSLVGESAFDFQTRPLRLESCKFKTLDRRSGQLTLHFNQAVSPDDLAEHLTFDGEPLGTEVGSRRRRVVATCLTRDPASKLVLQLQRPTSDNTTLRIDGELTGFGGEFGLGSTFKKELYFSPLFTLDSVYVSEPQFERSIAVHLDFSHRLDRGQASPSVSTKPPVAGMHTSIRWDELILHGPFKCGQRYTATVEPNLLSSKGKTLGEPQTISFEVPDREPGIRFLAKHGTLNPKGNLALDLELVNIAGVRFDVSRVTVNNIVPHLRGEGMRATGRDVVHRSITVDSEHNQPETVALDLGELIDQPLGIYRIEADATDHTWTSDRVIVSVTDLAITTKTERGGLWAWVTSLSTGQPAAGVTVRARSYNNQELCSGSTGADGTIHLDVPKGPDGPVWVVLAQLGQDLTYLIPEKRTLAFEDVDQSGRSIPHTYDIMLYTERGVYRPGDTIHLTGIIRDAKGQVPPAFPLEISIQRPDGRQVTSLAAKPEHGQGVFHADYTTSKDAQLGSYEFAATLPGSEEWLGGTTTLVEAFVPVRIEVEAEATSRRYLAGEDPELKVAAQYLFGKPAAGLPVRVAGQYRAITFESSRFKDFTFGDPNRSASIPIQEIEVDLDELGEAGITIKPPRSKTPGLWQGQTAVTVTEPGSRSVSSNVTLELDTAERRVGLYISDGLGVPIDENFEVQWVQLTSEDSLASPEPFTLELQRVERDWVVEEVNGRAVWKSAEQLIPVMKTSVAAESESESQGSLQVVCPLGGQYKLTAVDGESGVKTVLEFYAAANDAEARMLAMNRPEQLEISLGKKRYLPGSLAEVLVRSPFPGTLALTVERDRILHHQVVELGDTSARIQLQIPEDIHGGAFLAGSLVRPIDPNADTWLPHRALGMTRLVAENFDHDMVLDVDAPTDARPGETIPIAVQTDCPIDLNGPPVVHLWAVDEGILSATRYGTPDPLAHFLGFPESYVETSDIYSGLLPDHKRPESVDHIGAGDDESSRRDLRRSPVPFDNRKPAVVWSQIVPVDADGLLETEIVLPDLTGRLRLMAVVIDGDRYASTQRDITISTQLSIEAGWPRFAASGDTFKVPVKLFNSTGQRINVDLAVDVDGPLQGDLRPSGERLNLEPGKSATVWVNARAHGMGSVVARVIATAKTRTEGKLIASAEAQFPVRPASPPVAETKLVRVHPGKPIHIDPPSTFMAGTTRTAFRISPRPDVELLPAFEAVVGYPYGCVEQTSSRLLVLLHARDVLSQAIPDDSRAMRLPEMVEAGIARLWSMQTQSGGLAYWPGDSKPNLWGSAYAGTVLAEALEAGYEVDDRLAKDLAAFLKRSLRHDSTGDVDQNLRVLICHTLAAIDQPPQGWMSRLGERMDLLDTAGRAYLASAWNAAGRKDRAMAVLQKDYSGQSIASATGGRITSQLRQEALLLDVLCRLDAEHERIPALVQKVQHAHKNGRWGNTLENATALTALARYQSTQEVENDYSGLVQCGGADVLSFDHTMSAAFEVDNLTGPITVSTAGSGLAYATITTEGLPAAASATPFDRGLRVRRLWSDSDGQPIDGKKLEVGDLIRVIVSIVTAGLRGDDEIDNIAIVDVLPGGMEVENPRLAVSAHLDDSPNDEPDRTEFLDDRVLLFTSANREKRVFQYALRVVTAGSFALSPIQASCMYDADIASLHGGGRVEIQP